MGRLILIVGRTGSGKSTSIRRLFPPSPDTYVYDVQNEYTGYQSFFDEDLEAATQRAASLPDANLIFEEATIFFTSRSSTSQAMRRLIVGKRHRNQNIVFVFHQLSKIPSDIMGMADLIVLYATLDPPGSVYQKFKEYPELIRAFDQVRTRPKFSYATIRR